MEKILVVGANSAIAEAYAKLKAKSGTEFYLIGRDQDRLSALQCDLIVRGSGPVNIGLCDFADISQHPSTIEKAFGLLKEVDVVLVAHGTLPDQDKCNCDTSYALAAFNINAVATISILNLIANYLSEQKKGVIACISSVAGDRGRQSNFLYGSSKAAVTTYLQGLRNRLHCDNVSVVTIKPGFVDTPMTAHVQKNGFLWSQPELVAKQISTAILKKKPVVYTPKFWWFILLVVKLIPEKIFMRMSM